MHYEHLYQELCKWYGYTPPLAGTLSFFINAPFGRFAPSRRSIFLLDGTKSWIIMELFAPFTFLLALLRSPLSSNATSTPGIHAPPPISLHPSSIPSDPRTLLAFLFLTHYLNRALISPLRTPQRSRSHLIVPLFGVIVNITNGSLLGAYLSSPAAYAFLSHAYSNRVGFWLGVALWALGCAGNILHDEVLIGIRREAVAIRKEKSERKTKDGENGGEEEKPHYGIPHGYLYSYISYPNYLCEWIEWLGFALASAPFPSLPSFSFLLPFFQVFFPIPMNQTSFQALAHLLSLPGLRGLPSFAPMPAGTITTTAATIYATPISPPYLFFLAEIFFMAPRAIRGHRWYYTRFGDEYPRERRAIIPFLL